MIKKLKNNKQKMTKIREIIIQIIGEYYLIIIETFKINLGNIKFQPKLNFSMKNHKKNKQKMTKKLEKVI